MLTLKNIAMPDHNAPIAMTDDAVIDLAVKAAAEAIKAVIADSFGHAAEDLTTDEYALLLTVARGVFHGTVG